MHRIFVPKQNISDDKIIISDKEQVNHLKNALRLKVGEEVIVSDEKGTEYICEARNLAKEAVLAIKSRSPFRKKSGPMITIACALPKKSKFDDIIDKLTQLGVDRIIPLETERVIVKLDKNKKIARQQRWNKIAQSAAEQSQRNTLPTVETVKTIKEVLADTGDFDLKLILALFGERKTLKEVLAAAIPKNILVLIGPEGDFTDEELELAVKAGCIPVTLGETVLRVETAAISVASFIKLYCE